MPFPHAFAGLKRSCFKSVLYFFFVVGTLHVGDEIREINGMGVQGETVEKLQKLLVSEVLLFARLDFYILTEKSHLFPVKSQSSSPTPRVDRVALISMSQP